MEKNCLKTKLNAVVNSDELPYMAKLIENTASAVAGTAIDFRNNDAKYMKKSKIDTVSIFVEDPNNAISSFSIAGTGGQISIQDPTNPSSPFSGNPNQLYTISSNYINGDSQVTNSWGFYVAAAKVVGSGNVKFKMWIQYKKGINPNEL